MSNVQSFISPRLLLDYLNQLKLPVGDFGIDWNVIDQGAYYTVVTEDPTGVTTLKSERDLKEFIDTLPEGTILKTVVPKRAGGYFTYYSLIDESLGETNGFSMVIANSSREVSEAIDTATTVIAIIEHRNKTLIIFT